MLTLTNIQKTFAPGTVNEKKALCGIDLHLDAGDFVTILGSNGAGKSTLFGAIAGSFLPDTGSVVLDGQDITSLPDYKRSKFIGRLFQDPLRGPSRKIWPWPTSGPATAGPPSPPSQKRTGRSSGRSWPCWIWDWRTG